LLMNDLPFTIVGVMPPRFEFPQLLASDVWTPVVGQTSNDRSVRPYSAIARMKAGVLLNGVNSELSPISLQLGQQYPAKAGWSAEGTSLLDDTFGRYRSAFAALIGLVGVFFFIACVNVASLLLTRTAARQKELAIRTALGATRWRLSKHFFVEGFIVA